MKIRGLDEENIKPNNFLQIPNSQENGPIKVIKLDDDKNDKEPRKKSTDLRKKSVKVQKEELPPKEWFNYTKQEKTRFVVFSILKFILFIILLYLFLLSLNFMTIGFTLVSSYAIKAGDVIKFILKNPFAALAIGIIATAIMQNATATTSIAVSMVGAGIIPSVKNAIPIIMGSNIGTCVTNSFIALTLAGDPNEFTRAFSAATLNDMFNFLTTLVLLPLEIATDMLYTIADKLTKLLPSDPAKLASANFIGAILNPVTDLFIRLNVTAVDELNNGNKDLTEVALRCCQSPFHIEQANNTNLTNYILSLPLNFSQTIYVKDLNVSIHYYNLFFENNTLYANITECVKCKYWCMPMLRAFGDGGTGLFWIILSLIVLIASLFGIVKVLSLLIVGPIAKGVRKAVNASFPGKFKFLTEILLFIISFLLTLIVQSSNIITATLVPLCGIGIITLQRVYVMTLGSNIGTTVTGILSAFTQPPSSLIKSMQVAFVYTLFNTFGVIFWLPLPFMRFPKRLAKKLGAIVLKYKWFVYVYVTLVYFILPLIVFGLALIPYWIGLAIFGIPIIILFVGFLIILLLRKVYPKILPAKLKSFDWLPIWMRSLGYYDSKVKKLNCNCCFCCKKKKKRVSNALSPRISVVNNEIQETNVDEVEEDDSPDIIPSVIRRLSAIDSIVKEARIYSRRNTLATIDSDEDFKNTERRKSVYSEKQAEKF